jgi:hypothetical protein
MIAMNFCEKCGTKANESARFCSSCGFEIHPDVETSPSTPHRAKPKKFDIKTTLLATTSLITAALIGLVVVPNVFKPAELIEFSEIKLSVSDGVHTWIGTAPTFKVNLKSSEEKFNDTTVAIEKQDTQGQWSKVAYRDVESSGIIVIDGDKAPKAGKAIYRASVFQGDRYVESSKTKTIVFLPKKSNFTYVGRIGYRFFSQKEYDKSPCPGVNGCWAFHIVSRAKVRVEIKVLNGGKTLSETAKVEIPTINKVRVVKVSSFSPRAASGYFDHSEELLTAKDLKRIALEWKKKQQQQNKPTPTPTKDPQELTASAGQCRAWRNEADRIYRELQLDLARFLNMGDIAGAARVQAEIQDVPYAQRLFNSRCR